MFGLAQFSLLALALSGSALADSHAGPKRRSHPARLVEERDTANSTHTLAKRAFHGRGTFYDVGLGACGQWSQPGDYMVALNGAQYGGGYPGPQCFKTITIQANGVTVGGVSIMDECPRSFCNEGDLDLSRGRFASEDVGVLSLTWWFEGDEPAPAPEPTPEPTTSTWVEPTTQWTPPPSTEAPPTSTWTPPTSTSTWVAPTSTSTYVAPASSSAPPPSSSSSVAPSSSSSTLVSSSSAAANSTNPFAIIATDNSTATSTSLSASASASSGTGDVTEQVAQAASQGNLAAINGLVVNYGQLIVVGSGGAQ